MSKWFLDYYRGLKYILVLMHLISASSSIFSPCSTVFMLHFQVEASQDQ